MMFIDWCLIDTLFVSLFRLLSAVICTISSNQAWEEFPPKGRWREPRFGWLGIQSVIMKLPPSWGDKMDTVRKRKTHWGEVWARTDVAVLWGQTGQASVDIVHLPCKPVAQTAATRGRTRLGLWITDPSHHLQPSIEPKFLPAKIYLLFSSTGCFDCVFWAFTAIVNWTGVMHIYLL